LEQSSDNILSDEDGKIKELLEVLKFQENTISQIRQNLFDASNAVRYLRKSTFNRLNPNQIATIDRVLNDIESILPHTQFIFDKINFQLQTAMSYTNHTQNKIIKIFSVAAVVFMPPTLIASVYGMNFNIMPELQWKYGYLFAIILMFLSALLTYIVFKYKKWL
jgi:magnesium transporter